MLNGKYGSVVLTILRIMIIDSKRIDMKKDLGEAPLTIGGWLIFIGIRFFVVTMGIGNDAVRTLHMKFNALQLLFIILFMYTLIVLIFFSKRHKAFPVTYIIIEFLLLLRSILI